MMDMGNMIPAKHHCVSTVVVSMLACWCSYLAQSAALHLPTASQICVAVDFFYVPAPKNTYVITVIIVS